MSYIEKGGEWETRKISILGALQSFISQLSIGQELSKVSMPAVILSPYSAIELAGYRGLSFIHILLEANIERDPFRRFLFVLKWYLSYTQKEKMKRKPYNPIVGENHTCWVETPKTNNNSDSKKTITKFFGEQTSHHPPVTAFIIENSEENLFIEANICFLTKFYGNSASVNSVGKEFVHLKNFEEEYCFSKCMPDILVSNMIFGTKRISWEGEIILKCKKTGFQATIIYKEEGWHCNNVVIGHIEKISDPKNTLYLIRGQCGDVVTISDPNSKKEIIFEPQKLVRNKINYLPWEKLDEFSSMKVWANLSKAIEIDDMYKADMAKREVEEAQRKRRNDGKSIQPKFFKLEEDHWYFIKEKISDIDDIIFSGIKSEKDESLGKIPKGEEIEQNEEQN